MCKFNNRLFVFALYCLLGLVFISAKPTPESTNGPADELGAIVALAALMNTQDVHYDQRQKGEENYRISLDGFFIGLPQEETTALLVLTDDIFESLDDDKLLAYGKNKPSNAAPPSSSPSELTSAANRISPDISEVNKNHSANADLAANNNNNNAPPRIVEIPASKKFLEARNSVDPVSRTKSYISHFLNILKRTRKH